jgi:fumarylacetoacetase
VTLDELTRVPGEPQEPSPLDYLRIEPFAFDVPLEIELNGQVVSRTNARHLYWNVAQQVAHLTSNGSTLRTGDLLATGTISGPGERERGSLIELTWNEGPFLADGDEVVLRGEGLGEVRGRIAG